MYNYKKRLLGWNEDMGKLADLGKTYNTSDARCPGSIMGDGATQVMDVDVRELLYRIS